MNPPTILVVEDNPEDVLFLKKAFARSGWACMLEIAEDGSAALDRLLSGKPEDRPTQVLLDLKLPRKSGLDVLAGIRSNPATASLPVIVLTSSELSLDIDRAKALGVDAYLVKPVSFKGLVQVVELIAQFWKLPPSA